MKTIVVIPAYNEEETISTAVRSAREHADKVIVVDDGSKDQTGFKAKSAGALVLAHAVRRGQGAALRTGIRAALLLDAEIIVTFDADLQQKAEEIQDLVSPVAGKIVDVALGSRFLGTAPRLPLSRLCLLKLAVLFTWIGTGLKLTDTHNGFRALSRRAASELNLTQDGFAHASEILSEIARLNLAYKEVPVTVSYSRYSLNKGQKLSGAFRILIDLIRGDIFR